jgi:hypothetical protein
MRGRIFYRGEQSQDRKALTIAAYILKYHWNPQKS